MHRFRAMTLVELLIALVITSILFTTITTMLHAAAVINSALSSAITNQLELEFALRRMIQETRVCTTVTVPTGVSGGSAFSLVTQPDAGNGGATYNISYALVTVNGLQQLRETDTRYGTSVLIHDVQSFDVRLKSAGSPTVLILTLTTGRAPPSSRLIRIRPRNMP